MKKILYLTIYNPRINYILRNLALPFVRLLNKKSPFSISGKLNLKYNHVPFHLYTNQTCSVTQDIFRYGCQNYEFTPLFVHLVKQSEVFFDIGANIGYFTVLGEKMNPGLKTFSFEPSKGPWHFLMLNSKSNHLKNTVLINKALSNTKGGVQFFEVFNPKYPWLEHHLNGSGSLQNNYGAEKQKSYPVEATTIEAVVQAHDIRQIDLMKLDTECTEHLILESGLEIIQNLRPLIICEVYPMIQNEMQAILQSLPNYCIFHYKWKKLRNIQFLEDVADDEDRNFVFCPNEKLFKIEGFIMTG